jgi:hypothetical protein
MLFSFPNSLQNIYNFSSIFMPFLNLLSHNAIERAIKKEEQDGPGNDSEDSFIRPSSLVTGADSAGASIPETGTAGTHEGLMGSVYYLCYLRRPTLLPDNK